MHAALTSVFRQKGIFKGHAAFAAQKFVSTPLMAILATSGTICCGKMLLQGVPVFKDRVFGSFPLASFCTRGMAAAMLWDGLVHALVPSLRSPMMIFHHAYSLGLATVMAYSGLLLPYGAFFFGVFEISTVPLGIVDLFHPRRFQYLLDDSERGQRLKTLNKACQVSFGVSFLVLRIFLGQGIMCNFLRDCRRVVAERPSGHIGMPVKLWNFAVSGGFLLASMQSLWAAKVWKNLRKVMGRQQSSSLSASNTSRISQSRHRQSWVRKNAGAVNALSTMAILAAASFLGPQKRSDNAKAPKNKE
eukprot:gnl/MRDRNA2_/MRDRNA2_73298_c0_seq1.p1 gnl/MRDRNA2_/MRDRNA2_73298_c0~~gnl/MRDRNA2_/MRDRNA2_73298_c0_seq1.p1  ORF type:complete len:352 (+),score=32.66 gnl/MRDRNA2_/MRDRNA2_73298_c0_seq1:150-1058(+)